jgi:chemotaxis family two-component system response regulator Rcp1
MLRIALIEDNPADAQMFQMALNRTGIPTEVTLLEDGLTALEYLTGNNPQNLPRPCDVVLLDLNLPRLNGFEVLESIRATHSLMTLPVIVMSGSSNPVEVERCYRAGANSYICKPAHFDEILSTAAHFMAYWSFCVRLPAVRPCVISAAPQLK